MASIKLTFLSFAEIEITVNVEKQWLGLLFRTRD